MLISDLKLDTFAEALQLQLYMNDMAQSQSASGPEASPSNSPPPAMPQATQQSTNGGALSKVTGMEATVEVSSNASSNPKTQVEGANPSTNQTETTPSPVNKQASSFTHPGQINTQLTKPVDSNEGRVAALGGLSSIATAASAMEIDTENSMETPTSSAAEAHMLQTPLTAHPMSGDAATPTTPGFSMAATTPTTPYTPTQLASPLSGGGRSKHTCNHCNQTFTRHHNLKSHLLTHSHEKPYPCTQCNARFRRLHDLKRHSKLHTGERPHVCEKCGRRFARGDALARHARGEGGCAGRRSSMGGLLDGDVLMGDGSPQDADDETGEKAAGEEDGDSHMVDSNEGVTSGGDSTSAGPSENVNPPPNNLGTSSTGARRPASLPSIKTNVTAKSHAHQNHLHPQIQQIHQIQYGGTYPPMTPVRSAASVVGSSPASGLFPPTPNHHGKAPPVSAIGTAGMLGSRRGTSPMNAVGHNGNTGQILGSGGSGMSDPPRAISPGQPDTAVRGKSPLGQFNSGGKQPKYAPPMTPLSAQPQNPTNASSNQFGTSSGVNSHPRAGRQSQSPAKIPQQQQAPQAPMGFPQSNQQQQKGGSQSGSGTGGNENPNIFENERGIWDYVKELERRIVELENKQRSYDAIAQAQQSLAVAATAQLAAVSGHAPTAAGSGSNNGS